MYRVLFKKEHSLQLHYQYQINVESHNFHIFFNLLLMFVFYNEGVK